MRKPVAAAIAAIAVVAGLANGPTTAIAGGVCVDIDRHRDNLSDQQQHAVRTVIFAALTAEGARVNRVGDSCDVRLVAHSVKLGESVTATLQSATDQRRGKAANLEELDLLYRQLVRALMRGKSMATGTGVTDRHNVLRHQMTPRRTATRRWDKVMALGGGVMELPAVSGQPRTRQFSIVTLEGRMWGFGSSDRTAMELVGRIVLHDYEVVREVYGKAKEHRSGEALVYSPFLVPNYEAGAGFVHFIRPKAPSLFVRGGVLASLLLRLSDSNHYADLGIGVYAGAGFQLSQVIGLSASLSVSNPTIHNFLDTGYRYFATGSVTLDFRHPSKPPKFMRSLQDAPVQRRINE